MRFVVQKFSYALSPTMYGLSIYGHWANSMSGLFFFYCCGICKCVRLLVQYAEPRSTFPMRFANDAILNYEQQQIALSLPGRENSTNFVKIIFEPR